MCSYSYMVFCEAGKLLLQVHWVLQEKNCHYSHFKHKLLLLLEVGVAHSENFSSPAAQQIL